MERWVEQGRHGGVDLQADFGAGVRWFGREGEVCAEQESGVEGEFVASGAGGEASDGGGESAVAGLAQVDGGGPDRQAGRAGSWWGGESGGVSGGQDVAVVVDVDVDDVLVADEAGDGRVGWMRDEVVGGGDPASSPLTRTAMRSARARTSSAR